MPIPQELDAPAFRAAWADWLAERRARRRPVTERAARGQLAGLIGLGPDKAAECVRVSIANGWIGLFPERFRGPARGPGGAFPTKGQAQDAYAFGVLFSSFPNGGAGNGERGVF